MKPITLLTVLLAATRLFGCGQDDDPLEDLVSADQRLELRDRVGLLAFLNDQDAVSQDLLDKDCGIRSNAAANLIDHRDGPDRLTGTADDDLFESLAQVEETNWVGPWTMQQLYLCANQHGYLFGQQAGFMDFVNDPATSLHALDVDCEIRSDSAANIIAHREGPDSQAGTLDDNPFETVDELDQVTMVGLWTLDRLYACADAHGFLSEPIDDRDPGLDPDAVVEIWSLDQIEPALRARIEGDLWLRAGQLKDPDVEFELRFAGLLVYSLQGRTLYYEVRYAQYLDAECGTQLWITFQLDRNLNVTSESVVI
jgi:hypothetical protein